MHSQLVIRSGIVVCGLVGLSLTGAASAAPGDPDVEFGVNGIVEVPGIDFPSAVFALEDGGVLVVGHRGAIRSSNPASASLVRVNKAGIVVSQRELYVGEVTGSARMRDGRLIVAGFTEAEYNVRTAALRRFDADGTPDSSFGPGGTRVLRSSDALTDIPPAGVFATSILELPSGELIVGAAVPDERIGSPLDQPTQGVVIKLDPSGGLLWPAAASRPALSQRDPVDFALRADGRVALVARPGCCAVQPGLIGSLDSTGSLAFGESLQGFSPQTLALDARTSRTLVAGPLESQNGVVALAVAALGNDDRPLPDFAIATDGRFRLPPPAPPRAAFDGVRLLPTAAGGALALVTANPAYGQFRDSSSARLHVLGVTAGGRLDPAVPGAVGLPLGFDPDRLSRRLLVAAVRSRDGRAYVLLFRQGDTRPYPEEQRRPSLVELVRLDLGENLAEDAGAIGFAAASQRLGEGRAPREVRVLRIGGARGAARVRYSMEPGTAGTDDFEPIVGTLSWADGDAGSRTLALRAPDDDRLEGEERFVLRLSAPEGGVRLATEALQVTIEDDEALSRLVASATAAQIQEGERVTFSLQPDQLIPGPVSAEILVGDGVDPDGWPRADNRNSTGTLRVLMTWPANALERKSVEMRTNRQSGRQDDVTLVMRVADAFGPVANAAGWIGVTVRVVDAPDPVITTPQPPPVVGTAGPGGGGSVSLAMLIGLLIVSLKRGCAFGRAIVRTHRTHGRADDDVGLPRFHDPLASGSFQ